jgi:predicted transcriptional regulator
MEIGFTPEQEEIFSDDSFRAAVREGIAQADRGQLIEEDEMDERFKKMLRS